MELEPGFAVLYGEHLVALKSQIVGKSAENCRIVLDDEHADHDETSARNRLA
jgi:hypothetical protein